MSKHTQTCKSCEATISGEIYHLGFSDIDAVYCSLCPKALLLDNHNVGTYTFHKLVPGDKDWKEYDRHLLPHYSKAEEIFPPCPCGGSFRYMNAPRCPMCKEYILGEDFEDKPINRNLGYVFITTGSISMRKIMNERAWKENT